MRLDLRKSVALIGFALGLAMLIAQLPITITERMANGDTALLAIVNYLGYLTYLANIALVVVYAGELFASPALEWVRGPKVMASAAATILLVALFNHFILRPSNPPTGYNVYTDPMKHYVLPAIYLVWWLIWPAGGRLRFRDLPLVALPALLYPAYVFARGALINDYPYAVIDVRTKGYAGALEYAGVVVIGFAVICLLIIAIEKLIGRIKHQQPVAA